MGYGTYDMGYWGYYIDSVSQKIIQVERWWWPLQNPSAVGDGGWASNPKPATDKSRRLSAQAFGLLFRV